MKSIKQIIDDRTDKTHKTKRTYISREFQDFGYRLAMELEDPEHTSLYIKLAKTVDRAILEAARRFVIDSNADNKGALFMWKMAQLRQDEHVIVKT
ncbi:MAG: Uncharacterized protein G01um101416_1155 [Microgenomates group bacterium Gr01-1014_16]|nr:MAG: Uncharacterized protein G01um101416_1155 [Microgenomates group bacterium Gr01-1014_16]